MEKAVVGSIGWFDLTVENATSVRDFYEAVAGWKSEALSMGEYSDYVMNDAAGNAVSGVCHKHGANSGMPSQWLMYVIVANLEQSMTACRARGGTIVQEARAMGSYGTCCVIRDPAGAVCARVTTSARRCRSSWVVELVRRDFVQCRF